MRISCEQDQRVSLLISGVFTRILWFCLVSVSLITHMQDKEEAATVWQTGDKEAWSEAFGQEEPCRKLRGAEACGKKDLISPQKFCSQLKVFSGLTGVKNVCVGEWRTGLTIFFFTAPGYNDERTGKPVDVRPLYFK